MTETSSQTLAKPTLSNLMGDYIAKQKYVDCTFAFLDDEGNQIESQKFGAHTCILSTGSDVFETMFYGELKEKSPIVIKDIKQPIFKKLIGIIYQQDVKVHSAEEASDLYLAAQKYNVTDALLIARNYMKKNFNKGNAAAYFAAGLLHDDQELIQQAWSTIREDIIEVVKMHGFFQNDMATVPEAFDIEQIKDERHFAKSLEGILQSSKSELDLKKRVGTVLGLVQYLTSNAATALKSILDDDSLELCCQLVWKPPEGTMEKLNQIYQTTSCIKCQEFHNPFDTTRKCYGDKVTNIYLQYAHTNLNTYKIADLKALYEEMKQYMTVA